MHEAIYNAVSELASQGIKAVTYPSGHTDWADVAVRRAVMTGISQTAGQMQLDLAAEMGCDLVEVTSHMGARPSHAEWQGKVYSISGKSKKYPKLSTATGYGRGDGLKGWNCRHDFYPFFEGISERANLPVDVTENNRQYELSQKQRAMERSIRATKRRLAAYDGALADTDDEVLKRKLQNNFDRHSAILKTKEKRLSEFCDKNGLYPEKDRVRVVGFNKSVSQKAVHGSKRYIKQQDISSGSECNPAKAKTAENESKDKITTIDYTTGNSGKPELIKSAGVDKSSGSGIIESKELTRTKNRDRKDIKPISDEQFRRLTIEAEKNGAIIIRGGEEVEKHLDEMGADASIIGDVIFFRKDACLSEVLEETYHFKQNLSGLNDDKDEPLRTILNEMDAKMYLLDNAKKFKIPRSETELTEKQLESYLKEYEKYGGR